MQCRRTCVGKRGLIKMMWRSLGTLLLLVALSQSFGWCDGESFTVLRDPRTGVVLPLKRAPVGVERQRLDVVLVARDESEGVRREVAFEYRVVSTYWLFNPTKEEQVLKVAFPIPNRVVLREPPVWLDGTMVEWQLLDATDFLELHRPEMRRVFTKMLEKHKTLRTVLQKALKEWTPPRSKAASEAMSQPELPLTPKQLETFRDRLERELKLSPYELQPFWEAYLDVKGKRQCSIWLLFEIAYKYAGYRPKLLQDWAVFDWFLAPVTGKLIKWKPEPKSDWMPEWEEHFRLNILTFEVRLKPNTRHTLTVRYQQPAGAAWYEGAYEGFRVQGLHFTYVLKVRPSWAFFGPIDVSVRVPEYMRLRTVPTLRFIGVSKGHRVYAGKLQPYRYNLYAVAGTPDTFLPRVRALEKEIVGRRFDKTHIFVPIKEWFDLFGSAVKWDMDSKTATVYCEKGKHATIVVGQRTVQVHGEKVEMPAPVHFSDNRVWIPVRGLPALAGKCFRVKRINFDRESGNVEVISSD